MNARVRVALFYGSSMLSAIAFLSVETPEAPRGVRLVLSGALLGGTLALLAFVVLHKPADGTPFDGCWGEARPRRRS